MWSGGVKVDLRGLGKVGFEVGQSIVPTYINE